MGCFLGCFGGEEDQKRRRPRVNRSSPQRQRNRVPNVHQAKSVISEQPAKETVTLSEQSTKENITISEKPTKDTVAITNLVSKLQTEPEVVEQTSLSPKKRVTFNSNITTYEHIQAHDSIESLPEHPTKVEKEIEHVRLKKSGQSKSVSSEDNSVASSVAFYPPNHRYHNVRDSDDEAEEYGDSDLDDDDDDDDDLDGESDKENGYGEYDDDIDAKTPVHDIWSEPPLTESVQYSTGKNPFSQAVDEEVERSPIVPGGLKGNARDRGDYTNSVLNPVENITQWKAVKSKGTSLLKPEKENLNAADNLEPPRMSLSLEPTYKKKSDLSRTSGNREVAVDASLANWLPSPEVKLLKKTSNFGGFETNISGNIVSEGHNAIKSFEDRPIMGELTVEELRQISATNSPRKSPNQSPDEMPIRGAVGTYWNGSSSKKQSELILF